MHNKCIKCGADLVSDDVGATKKLINRSATEFMCVKCLAIHFSVSEQLLRGKIEYWRSTGCLLFANDE